MKLVKHQVNGDDHLTLKDNATIDDLRAEADRLRRLLGYEVRLDERLGQVHAAHPFYRGKFLLTLEPD